MMVRKGRDVEPFVTLNGSTIREIIHPSNTPSVGQRLAEARLAPRCATAKHVHKRSEEIYYILSGKGRMHLGGEDSMVGENDAIYIPSGTEHFIENTGDIDLIFLCSCMPPYSDGDTEIL
ncbi:MAG: cupin domain-containing protein [Candidatus Binatia bacterium]